MKPDWKDAPEWAQWLAMNQNGDWYWFENAPNIRGVTWGLDAGRRRLALNWSDSLESRPSND